jgi:hypothetical protein
VLIAGMCARGKKHGSLLIPSLHFARMTSQEQARRFCQQGLRGRPVLTPEEIRIVEKTANEH